MAYRRLRGRSSAGSGWTERTALGLLALGGCSEGSPDRVDASLRAGPDAASTQGARLDAAVRVDAGRIELEDSGISQPELPSASEQVAALQPDHVSSVQFARRVLFSWTTDEQASELRATPTLLTRSERSDGTRTKVSEALATLASADDALAKVLTGPAFQKGRFGWPNAWSTLRGWPDESYGKSLLRIVLKPEAWLAHLADGELRVFDLQQQPIALEQALATPERIAAVFFVNTQRRNGYGYCGTFVDCAPSAYREYFVNNEAMIEEWSLGTDAILAEIERGRDLVSLLRRASDNLQFSDSCDFSGRTLCTWGGELPPNSSLTDVYASALALASPYYEPTVENLTALELALEAARFTLNPFVHQP